MTFAIFIKLLVTLLNFERHIMNKEYIIKRFKSFGWRFGGIAIVAILGVLVEPEMVKAMNMPNLLVLVIGLIANEITKYLNTGVK